MKFKFLLIIFIIFITLIDLNAVSTIDNEVIKCIEVIIENTKEFYNNRKDNTPRYIQEKNYFTKIDLEYSTDWKYIENNINKYSNFISEKLNIISQKKLLQLNEIYTILKCLSYYETLSDKDVETLLSIMEFADSFLYDKGVNFLLKADNSQAIKNYLINKYNTITKINEKSHLALLLVQLDIGNIDYILKDYISLKEELTTSTIFMLAGDQTIPFLREQLKSDDWNTKYNSIMLLGVLLDYESYDELKELYLMLNDTELKLQTLSMLLILFTNIDEVKKLKKLCEKFLIDEQKNNKNEKRNINTIQENIFYLENFKSKLKEFKLSKKYDKKKFEEEYSKLFESNGENGDLNIIKENSSIEDETQLRKLKSRIVRGFIDLYIEDYHQINEIIRFNRLIKAK